MPNHSFSLYLYPKKNIIANKSLHINKLKEEFSDQQKISIQDLINFYKQFEEQIKRSTVDWRIYKLNQEGILHRISRGIYSLSPKEKKVKEYIPEINRSLKNISSILQKKFPYIDICLWSTKWLNEFMLHQPGRFHTVLEVEKDAMESVFYELSAQRKDVFLDPSKEIMNNYVINSKDPIIITRLITEAPTNKVKNVVTTTLEKMLVDIYSEPELYATYQGAEMKRIYQTSFEKYQIIESKMLRYASRRTKKGEIQKLINTVKERQ